MSSTSEQLALPAAKAGWSRDTKVIALIAIAHFVSHVHVMLLPPILGQVREAFGVSYTQIALALTAFNVASALLQTPAGFLVDRIGPRQMLTAGLILAGAAITAAALLPGYWFFVIAYALMGVANTVYHPADYSILSAAIDGKKIGKAFSIHTFAGYLGFGVTPAAMATAPIATQSKTPMVVMAAGTSAITEASPYIVRTSFTLPQATVPIAEWATKNGIKKAVSLVADFGPGFDAEKFFAERFTLNGGQVLEKLRTPLRSPDFAPVLQKVRDLQPDALFVFLPSGQGAQFMKQFGERGLDKAGIRLIATGDVTDDDQLNDMGDVALGVVNSHHYSAAHNSAANKKFVEAFIAANKFRPNFMAVGGYDGMRVIYNALNATKGQGGEALLNAMKGQIFESPRGQVLIDAQTRDIVQDIYIRKVERVNGQLWNVEFDSLKAVKDPGKLK
jgi:branched-chain amino acid transport system substrate-binding protein